MRSFRQYLFESSSGHLYKLDYSPIKTFEPRPYVMDVHGNSQRGDTPLEGHKPFSGVYAGPDIARTAPYALNKDGKSSGIPWIAVHKPGQRPLLVVHHKDITREHSPVILSAFSRGDFTPRHEVVRRLHGTNARDTGDDEYIATKSVSPLLQTKITDIPAFLQQHMHLVVIPSVSGERDDAQMSKLARQYKRTSGNADVIMNGTFFKNK